ncbi:MAG: GntR family transcriptional regulator [Oscillospiraceae bacterium]
MPRHNILYKNVYHNLCTRIFANEFDCCSHLPSMTELAEEYHVSLLTIHSTFKLLQDVGLIHVTRGTEAEVLYRKSNPISIQKLHQWLADRLYTMSAVYHMAVRLTAHSVEYGARLCDDDELQRLVDIADKACCPDCPINRVAFYLIELYTALISCTKNDLLLELLRAGDEYMSISMLLVVQDQALCEKYNERARSFIKSIISKIESKDFDSIACLVNNFSLGSLKLFEDYIKVTTSEFCPKQELLFKWTVFGNENLYSEIANDLIMRISMGEFFDGERLPCEQKLQLQYGVSAKTIRIALAALNECGIIKTVNGIGSVLTYLSSPPPAERYLPDAADGFNFFNSLQLIMLNVPTMLRESFLFLTDEEISTTENCVNRLLGSKDKAYYVYGIILLDLTLRNGTEVLTNQVFRQLFTRIFLFRHKSKGYKDIFERHFDACLPYITDALVQLKARNVENYICDIKQILSLIATSTRQMCAASSLHYDIPIPY